MDTFAKLYNLEQEKNSRRVQGFLKAWKRGIRLAGEQYFLIEGDLDSAANKWQLKPDTKLIAHSLNVISKGQATFLAAMYSFYNGEEGQKYLEQIGCVSLPDIAAVVDNEQVEIIAELFKNYGGW